MSDRMKNRTQDEWGAILEAQTKIAQTQDSEDRRSQIEIKKLYKQDLDRQLELRNLNLEEAKIQRMQENLIVKQKADRIKQWDQQEKLNIKQKKQSQYEAYQSEISDKLYKTQSQFLRTSSCEKEFLDKVNQGIQEDKILKQKLKAQQINDAKQMLHCANQKTLQKQQATGLEKQRDSEYAQKAIEQFDLREQTLQSHTKKKISEVEKKTIIFEPTAKETLKKELESQQLISQRNEDYHQRQSRKLFKETQHKDTEKQRNTQTLKQQINEKEKRRERDIQTFLKEKQETDAQISKLQAAETNMKVLKELEKLSYNQTLAKQSQDKSSAIKNQAKLTEQEWKFHFGGLQNSASLQEFNYVGVPGIYKEVSPAQRFHTTYSGSFQGSPLNSPGRLAKFDTEKHRYSLKCEAYFSPEKHDPIVNPIGRGPPKPVANSLYNKGRGIALLHAGANITRPF